MTRNTETLPPGLVDDLLRAARAAPSLLNTQPWRLVVRDTVVDVYADLTRSLPVTDPDGRELTLACGAALFNLRVAAAHAGREPVVRLLPHRAVPTLLASVRLAGGPARDRELAGLYEAIRQRRTNRNPFRDEPVPPELRVELSSAAEAEDARLYWLAGYDAWLARRLATEAELAAEHDLERQAEFARWTGTDPASGEGIPAEALGPRVAGRSVPLRDFAPDDVDRPAARFERESRLALLVTEEDGPADWLRAGQAMQRVLLVATARGLAASFLSAPLERADLRPALRDPEHGMEYPQMLLRIGWPTTEPPVTPRRPPGHD